MIALSAGETTTITITSRTVAPITVTVKVGTARQTAALSRQLATEISSHQIDELLAAIAPWVTLSAAELAALPEALSVAELWELAWRIVNVSFLGDDDRKKSESQSPCASGGCAVLAPSAVSVSSAAQVPS